MVHMWFNWILSMYITVRAIKHIAGTMSSNMGGMHYANECSVTAEEAKNSTVHVNCQRN